MQDEKKQLFCSIRKTWVPATPEEYVRQEILLHLVQLGFPSSCIAVEKELQSMPHIASNGGRLPDRRLDILCYAKREDNEGLHPLLLIECKAVPISAKELRQVIGYNHLLKASFIALVNQTEKKLGWFDPHLSDYKFVNYFPTYAELMNSF